MLTKTPYLSQVQSLLPPGDAWTKEPDANLTKVLSILANRLGEIDERSKLVIKESDPRQTLYMLPEWETALGLPDGCTDVEDTLQERRALLLQRLQLGGHSKPFFKNVAEILGYEIEITQFYPFVCGLSHCGEELGGPEEISFYWQVKVLGPRLTYFRSGNSSCGEPLLKISRAEDLECIFMKLKHSHTTLIFSYEGE